jgi:predicted transcriptional regulator
MKTRPEAITLDEAISLVQDEPTADVLEWQMEQLKQRHREADEGRFASSDAVKAVIRKFVPNG